MSLLPHGHQSGMFIKAPIATVADCLVKWGNEEKVNRGTKAEQVKIPLEQAWQHVADREPSPYNPDRAFLIFVGRSWTGFFNNHSHEWVASAEMHVLCQRLKAQTCFFSFEDNPRRGEHCGSAQFNHCHYENGEFPVSERQVSLSNEGGWKFQQSGDPLPFENMATYAQRKKRDRLTPELLRTYGEALGIPFWDADAYGQDVVLLRWGKQKPSDSTSALRKVMQVFGRPSAIMDRHGARKPPI